MEKSSEDPKEIQNKKIAREYYREAQKELPKNPYTVVAYVKIGKFEGNVTLGGPYDHKTALALYKSIPESNHPTVFVDEGEGRDRAREVIETTFFYEDTEKE